MQRRSEIFQKNKIQQFSPHDKTTGKLPFVNLSHAIYRLPRSAKPCQPLYERRTEHQPFPNRFYDTNKFLNYRFVMHKTLRLNLTLDELYIPAKYIVANNTCFSGFLVVNSFLSDEIVKLHYCGRLACISSYPVSKNISVEVKAKPLVMVHAEIVFSIFDKKQLKSAMTASSEVSNHFRPHWSFTFLKRNSSFLAYFIKTNALNTLSVAVFKNVCDSIQVFDGPGSQSKQLQSQNYLRTYSLFQTCCFQATIFCTKSHFAKREASDTDPRWV